MNEDAQISAMRAEMISEGYDVRQDVDLREVFEGAQVLDGYAGLKLDLVGTRLPGRAGQGPSIVVWEIANRARPAADGAGKGRSKLSDEDAVRRFDAISGYAHSRPDVVFQIRFLDVSREQARSRRTKGRDVGDKEALGRDLIQDAGQIAKVRDYPDDLKSLLVARTWAKWLRTAGQLHGGRSDRSLKTADLRVIQKDLYDHGVLGMSPSDYNAIHSELMAVTEGGDFSPAAILRLEPEMRSLLTWAADRCGIEIGAALDGAEADEPTGPRV